MRSGPLVAMLALLAAAGCGPLREPRPPAPPAMNPGEVIAAHNAWAASIQHVWSRAAITVSLPGENDSSRRQTFDLDGHLFVVKPDDLFLHGQVLMAEVFQVGMNAERYWVAVRPEGNTVWTGRRGGPGERRVLLSASDLMTALGLFEVHPDPKGQTFISVRPQQYILTEYRDVGDKWVLWRRTWFDRRTLRPVRIDLFDAAGRPVMMSEALAYETVDSTDVCTVYRIRCYGGGEVDVTLRLSAVSLTKPVSPKVFEYRPPADARIEDLDAASAEAP